MQSFNKKIGLIFFIGIGGIGMSGIAEVLKNLGFNVKGSDISDNQNVKRLRNLGIKIYIGHSKSNLEDSNMAVVSSAIQSDNEETRSLNLIV